MLQTLRFAPTAAQVLVLKATLMANEDEAVKAEKLGVELFQTTHLQNHHFFIKKIQ